MRLTAAPMPTGVAEPEAMASRADLKSDLLKDLERHKGQFLAYRGNPAISEEALDAVLARIEHAFN